MTRRAKLILGGLLALPLAGLAAVVLLLPHLDLAAWAAARATAALGRAVTIESLRITPGSSIAVEIRGARLANIPTGTAPEMATLARARATVDLLPLLRGQVVLRDAEAEGFTLLLERDAERRRNWRFTGDPAGPAAPPTAEPPDRSGLPLIGQVRLARSEVVFRTSGGRPLRTEISRATIGAPAAGDPLRLVAEGAYNDVPLALEGTLGTAAQLRAGRTPFPATLRATAGDAVLTFEGTMADPLNADRLDGRIRLAAPRIGAISAMAGGPEALSASLELAGAATRNGDLWRLAAAEGSLDGARLAMPLFEITEGGDGRPDAIVVEADFARLDMNRLLGPPAAQPDGEAGDADLPLRVFATPDPLVRARLSAQDFVYARLRGTEAQLAAAIVPGRIALETLAITAFGGRIAGTATLEAHEGGGRISAETSLDQAELDTLRRAFGLRALPVRGRLDGRVAVLAEGTTLNEAARQANISAVVAMRGGSIAKEVIEMASTDIRALFRTARGHAPLTCVLAVTDIRAGRGETAPLRIRAATGTISGLATFDLNRRRMDLVIGSQRETTSSFALDIPVRVSGSFADPDIAPANWSAEGRARLAAGDRVAPLPPPLRDFARQNPCYRAGGRR